MPQVSIANNIGTSQVYHLLDFGQILKLDRFCRRGPAAAFPTYHGRSELNTWGASLTIATPNRVGLEQKGAGSRM